MKAQDPSWNPSNKHYFQTSVVLDSVFSWMEGTALLPVALDSNPQSERKEDSLLILLFGEKCCAISYITIYVKNH